MPGFKVGNIGGVSDAKTLSAQGQQEFYYKYTWEVTNLLETALYHSPNDLSLIYLKDASLPTFTAQSDSIIGTALEYKWAKSVIWDDIKISWYDTVGLLSIMKSWRKSVWDETTGLQPGSVYKKMSEIRTYLPTWESDSAVNWRLFNSWPKIIKYGELTYTQSDVKIVEVTVSYDWADENTT